MSDVSLQTSTKETNGVNEAKSTLLKQCSTAVSAFSHAHTFPHKFPSLPMKNKRRKLLFTLRNYCNGTVTDLSHFVFMLFVIISLSPPFAV